MGSAPSSPFSHVDARGGLSARHWPLLRELRDALRTEPNVRLTILFGSQAAGNGYRAL